MHPRSYVCRYSRVAGDTIDLGHCHRALACLWGRARGDADVPTARTSQPAGGELGTVTVVFEVYGAILAHVPLFHMNGHVTEVAGGLHKSAIESLLDGFES